MMPRTLLATALVLLPLYASAEELLATAGEAGTETSAVAATAAAEGTNPERPKTLSGMSILGNEEAPKSLVIIPWKSSELGERVVFSDSLDASATPVDKEVFMRQLEFHSIRSSD